MFAPCSCPPVTLLNLMPVYRECSAVQVALVGSWKQHRSHGLWNETSQTLACAQTSYLCTSDGTRVVGKYLNFRGLIWVLEVIRHFFLHFHFIYLGGSKNWKVKTPKNYWLNPFPTLQLQVPRPSWCASCSVGAIARELTAGCRASTRPNAQRSRVVLTNLND